MSNKTKYDQYKKMPFVVLFTHMDEMQGLRGIGFVRHTADQASR